MQQLHLHLLKQPSYISTTLPSFPPHNTKKKAVRKTQIKKNIALRQNCDQAGTILWSTQSSAWHWWVTEWYLTLNQSTHNNSKPNLMIWDIFLDWLFPLQENHFFCYRDIILKKQTTSIFRNPPVDTNSQFLWNTANQIICYPNQDIISIHQSEKLKQKPRQWLILENLNYKYHIMFITNIEFSVTGCCTSSELKFLLPCQMKQ